MRAGMRIPRSARRLPPRRLPFSILFQEARNAAENPRAAREKFARAAEYPRARLKSRKRAPRVYLYSQCRAPRRAYSYGRIRWPSSLASCCLCNSYARSRRTWKWTGVNIKKPPGFRIVIITAARRGNHSGSSEIPLWQALELDIGSFRKGLGRFRGFGMENSQK